MIKRIAQEKAREVEARAKRTPLPVLKEALTQCPTPRDFAAALIQDGRVSLIGEIKSASPSAGTIRAGIDPGQLARIFETGGVAAVSVLTEERFFGGRLEYLSRVRECCSLPILQKDFILDEYQVYEARVYGADALLLIARLLSEQKLAALFHLSHGLGLVPLMEVHDLRDVGKVLDIGAQIIVINNRDLETFAVDLGTTSRLRPHLPRDKVVISASGIKSAADVVMLARTGVHALLVGEAIMRSADIPQKVEELISAASR
ncbi:MAG: indole-3-glycerol phosphate synthase TrpC [Thermodesulfobacteriota bacterium]